MATTPLQMALVAAGIANQGVIMRPHLGHIVTDDVGQTVDTIEPKEWKRATSAATANQVRDYMIQVVNGRGGTGTAARLPGITVAGKTGTAQTDAGRGTARVVRGICPGGGAAVRDRGARRARWRGGPRPPAGRSRRRSHATCCSSCSRRPTG